MLLICEYANIIIAWCITSIWMKTCEILCSFFDYIYVTPPNLVGKGVVKCFEKQVSIGGSTASREAWFFRGVEIRYLKILKIHKILKACVG